LVENYDILRGEISELREEMSDLHEEMHRDSDDLQGEINALCERMESNFRWTVGLILGMWASTLAILIPILLRVV